MAEIIGTDTVACQMADDLTMPCNGLNTHSCPAVASENVEIQWFFIHKDSCKQEKNKISMVYYYLIILKYILKIFFIALLTYDETRQSESFHKNVLGYNKVYDLMIVCKFTS